MKLRLLLAALLAALSTSVHAQTPTCTEFAGTWHNSRDVLIDLSIDQNCDFRYKAEKGSLKPGGGDNDRFTVRRVQDVLVGTVVVYSIIEYGIEFKPAETTNRP